MRSTSVHRPGSGFACPARPAVWIKAAERVGSRNARLRCGVVPDTIVFIPAWNEEETLPAVLDELQAELPSVDVLVVYDGSTDATARIASERGAEVLSFGEPRPPGRDRRRVRVRSCSRLRLRGAGGC